MAKREVVTVECPACKGAGAQEGRDCPECGGKKVVNRVYCWTCGKHSRKIDLEKCDFCDDTGHARAMD